MNNFNEDTQRVQILCYPALEAKINHNDEERGICPFFFVHVDSDDYNNILVQTPNAYDVVDSTFNDYVAINKQDIDQINLIIEQFLTSEAERFTCLISYNASTIINSGLFSLLRRYCYDENRMRDIVKDSFINNGTDVVYRIINYYAKLCKEIIVNKENDKIKMSFMNFIMELTAYSTKSYTNMFFDWFTQIINANIINWDDLFNELYHDELNGVLECANKRDMCSNACLEIMRHDIAKITEINEIVSNYIAQHTLSTMDEYIN